MKKTILTLTMLIIATIVLAQTPRKMSYQAVIRDTDNKLIINKSIGMRISILQGSATGTEIFKELYNPNPHSNANGLVTIEIGGGVAVTGNFETIDWTNGLYFIKTEIDPLGGTNYTISGTSQLLSVPFAIHSQTAEKITGTLAETDPVFKSSAANSIKQSDILNWNNKLGSSDEVDPFFTKSVAHSITGIDTAYWNKKLNAETAFNASVARKITAND
ncbi:MAG: hypothetical protein Q8905_15070, partial [Bacteroidota bacterium]|nr:hypothetical protein [Bacteroidota bacterium]